MRRAHSGSRFLERFSLVKTGASVVYSHDLAALWVSRPAWSCSLSHRPISAFLHIHIMPFTRRRGCLAQATRLTPARSFGWASNAACGESLAVGAYVSEFVRASLVHVCGTGWPGLQRQRSYIHFGTWGRESAAWVNEVWAVNEFPEARDKREEFHTEIDSPEKEALHPFREERIDDYCGLKHTRIS